jgi:BirA family transcriptional regulator, biotin operon repressor / biotin---[acetyl-CoA-carboxylase] ligase
MPFDQRSIVAGLATRLIGRQIVFVPTIGSTQDLAKELALQGAPEGTLVIADAQSAGRGRLARRWMAPAGSSLLMSLILRPQLDPARLHRLTMVCSLGLADGVRDATGLEVGIKWPNDIVTWPGAAATPRAPIRKLAGLLTESGFVGERMDYALVGMGINVNLDPADLPETITPATSLSTELGRRVDRLSLLWAILLRIEERYAELAASEPYRGSDPDPILAAWSARLVTLGQRVHVSAGPESVDGRAESVDADGALLVRTDQGTLRRITVGDVSLRESQDTRT